MKKFYHLGTGTDDSAAFGFSCPAWRCAFMTITTFVLASCQDAQALVSLPFYENFPAQYAVGGSLGTPGVDNANWMLGSPDTNIVVSATNAQSYSGLQLPPSGSQGVLVKKISNEDVLAGVGMNYTAVTANPDGVSTNSLYASFLLDVITRPTASDRTVATLSGGATVPAGGNGDLSVVLTTGGSLALARDTVSFISSKTPVLTTGATYLVVARYNFLQGGESDTLDLWLDPTNLGVADANIPTPTIPRYTATNANVASLVSFFIVKEASASDPASWALDEFRIGTNWASVTPPATVAVPSITSIALGPGNAVTINFTCSDNSPATAFSLETTARLASPASWGADAVATIKSVSVGNYQAVTTLSGGDAQFYCIGH
jgi:hypothetical protein